MKKHAILILTHNQFDLLKLLLKKLDHENIDFYILVDKKSTFNKIDFDGITTKSSVNWTQRISVFWGDYSLVKAELLLLKSAIKKEYDYYHLISGVDLPIKPVEDIIQFFETTNKEYIEVLNTDEEIQKRYRYCYFLQKYSQYTIINFLNKLLVKLQMVLHINRTDKTIKYAKGSNWGSITNDFASYIVKNEKIISKLFQYGFCVDEIFLQTMLVNSPFLDRFENNNLRFILWDQDNVKSPKTLTINDKNKLQQSNCLFARKFNIVESKELIQELYEESQ